MLVRQRSPQQASPPPFSSAEQVSSHNKLPPSPPRTPPRGRRPSLSHIQITKPMNWLSRSSTSTSTHSAPNGPISKPIRISEPKFNSAFDILNPSRSGALGTGATVVRTPQEALAISAPHELHEDEGYEGGSPDCDDYEDDDNDDRELPSPPGSPPLPPIPMSKSSPSLPIRESPSPPRPTRAPPPPPVVAPPPLTLRPSLKRGSPPSLEHSPPVPSLPNNITSSPPQPPFEAILVSPVPNSAIDPSKIIVSLETSTMTHRTTLSTLTSRPSYLSTYLVTLLHPRRDSDAESVSSRISDASGTPDSAFNSIFHNHLTSAGLLPQSTSSVHIFLDRPSAPYAHILSYLRSPPSAPETPAVLPRAAQLHSLSSSRLEALLELRDEARYLDLDELYKLCTDELRARQGVDMHTHTRGVSSVSSGSSIRSVHTFRDRDRSEDDSDRAGLRDSSATAKSVANNLDDVGPTAVAPTIASLRGQTRGYGSLSSRPPSGWI